MPDTGSFGVSDPSVVGGNQALPQDCKESMPRTPAWEVVVGGLVYLGVSRRCPLGFQCPISFHPVMEKVQPGLARPTQPPVSRVSAPQVSPASGQLGMCFHLQSIAALRCSGSPLEHCMGLAWPWATCC